jgi:hypothetical protein
MKLVVTVFNAENMPEGSQQCEPGQPLTFHITSPYLVSSGQSMPVGVTVHEYDVLASGVGRQLRDARFLWNEETEASIVSVPVVWDVSFIPSTRLLVDILADVVDHGHQHPSHGINCICMDQYAREIRLQLSKAIPPDGRTTDTDWAAPIQERLNAKARIRYVLDMVLRGF